MKFAALRREISSLAARDLCGYYIKFHMAVAASKSVRIKLAKRRGILRSFLILQMRCILARCEIKFYAAYFYVMYASDLPLLVSAMSASA